MDTAHARKLIEGYIAAFNKRDLEALSLTLSDDASLTDWEVSAAGKENMLEVTRKIVNGARVQITVRRILVDLPHVAADLSVRVNDQVELEVVDIFGFSKDGLISSVRAFRGSEKKL